VFKIAVLQLGAEQMQGWRPNNLPAELGPVLESSMHSIKRLWLEGNNVLVEICLE